MKQLLLKIYGDVQAVSFRWGSKEKATELGLVGWVKNVSDGTVEIVVEGDEGDLKKFLKWCKVGSRLAKVKKVDEEWKNILKMNFDLFKIVPN